MKLPVLALTLATLAGLAEASGGNHFVDPPKSVKGCTTFDVKYHFNLVANMGHHGSGYTFNRIGMSGPGFEGGWVVNGLSQTGSFTIPHKVSGGKTAKIWLEVATKHDKGKRRQYDVRTITFTGSQKC
ncbi:hypothetical protein T439DRAFT_350799 [Meredithblackwellia eburnea MCA 4105]